MITVCVCRASVGNGVRALTNAFYFSEKSDRFLGNFLDLTRTKILPGRFLHAICQILKSNFPRFKRSSAMLKVIL